MYNIYIYIYTYMSYVMCSAQPVHELSTRCQTCMRHQEKPESLRLTCLPEWCGVARFGTHNKQKQTSAALARQDPVRGSRLSACLRQRLWGHRLSQAPWEPAYPPLRPSPYRRDRRDRRRDGHRRTCIPSPLPLSPWPRWGKKAFGHLFNSYRADMF